MSAAQTSKDPAPVVLVIEDDAGVRESIEDCLRCEGYEVVAVENGSEALAWLAGHAPPCVILLDLFMPVMDGEDFRARQLRDPALAGIPVVLITAAADGGQKARDLGAAGYLRKPLSLARLLDVVEAHR